MEPHDDCAKQRELDAHITATNGWQASMERYQATQNGSIQRIEAKVDEIHRGQMDFYPAFYKLLDGEVDRRRADDTELSGRIDGLDDSCNVVSHRLDTLEVLAKLPGWTWKAIAAALGLVVVVLTILSLSHVI
jgi:hypothetical protein